MGNAGQVNYSAAKAGMIGATKALAKEIAKRNVTVNAVAPGFIRTDMTKDFNEKEMAGMIPMRRFGEVEEVADAVVFLASPKASYITGNVININGGVFT
jgi:3-oxoacyl-[acyl-carrier protein] reductase